MAGLGLVSVCVAQGGCVVGRIADDLHSIDAKLTASSERIAETEATLSRTNELLAEANQRLDRIEAQLAAVRAMGRPLEQIEEHLAGIRQTVENIDRLIPMVDFAEPDVEPER
jgi:chromosome segregation ATPase